MRGRRVTRIGVDDGTSEGENCYLVNLVINAYIDIKLHRNCPRVIEHSMNLPQSAATIAIVSQRRLSGSSPAVNAGIASTSTHYYWPMSAADYSLLVAKS